MSTAPQHPTPPQPASPQATPHPAAPQTAAPHSGAPQPTAPHSAAPHPAPHATAPFDPFRAPGTPAPAPATAPALAVPTPAADRRDRPRWWPVVGVAAVTALTASLATVGITNALDEDPAAAPTSVATLGQEESTTVPVAGSDAQDPDWEAVADAVRASVVAIDVATGAGSGTGSGVIVDPEGHVLTNDHVVGDAVDGGLQVTLADGRVYEATLVGTDPTTDLAVIQLVDPPDDLSPAVLGDSDDVAVGEAVMAVGNPLGLDSTVTTGIVSALDRPVSTSDGSDETVVTNAIQIDAAINPGNSGGPLFDASGQVIGITSSIASLSSGGGQAGSIGLGFAIPANLADRIGGELIADGTAEHAFLGVALGDGTATADGTTRRGAVVEQVTAGSPAAEADLQAKDVVVAIDGQAVNGAESLTAFVRELAAGTEVTLTVVRDGEAVDVPVTLTTRDDQGATQTEPEDQGGLFPGRPGRNG
ncbi:S1C family serine protease [Actinotalea solisilvae]|uniref:S1C family serine protease n=1 Tax=Actinotalea solisilvae TaxID=2072922 RepID=UPI0018F1614E|nr:trypsin-like peptidase domain-containing protein [Actinotalea solisilvae]